MCSHLYVFFSKLKTVSCRVALIIKLEHFEEAVHDTTAELTYCALSGIRKQNLEDVERLFGLPLQWMESKGYNDEAIYLRVIHNWRHARDERELTDEQRRNFITRNF